MKKFTTLMLSFLCIAALLTGCVESDIGVKLNADETGTISATIGIEEDFYDQLVDMGATVFEDKETTTYEYEGKTYISYAESTEYKSFDEIEQALLAMTYETDIFEDLEDSDIPVEDVVADDAELPEADEETEADEEVPAPETDTHVFKSVEIEKNGGIFYTAYSFKAELNPQTAASDDESMILSLVTLAIILAAAIDILFASPLTIGICLISTIGIVTASFSNKSGLTLNFPIASLIASYVACKIFISSILSWLTTPIPTAMALSIISSYSISLLAAVSFLESLIYKILHSFGRITAHATTGPAKGPLPTSSIPHIYS